MAEERTRLTEEQAQEIYLKYHRDGVEIEDLCREFNASKTSVYYVVKGKSWRRVTRTLDRQIGKKRK